MVSHQCRLRVGITAQQKWLQRNTECCRLSKLWRHHGLPDAVSSDRGPQFVAAFTWELYYLLGIKLSTTTAYHPQSDGQMERVNQEMEQFLLSFVDAEQLGRPPSACGVCL
jgi:transposase InsO family protein